MVGRSGGGGEGGVRGITEAVATESIYFTGCRPKVEIKAEFQGVNGQRSIPNAVATPGVFTGYRPTAMTMTEY